MKEDAAAAESDEIQVDCEDRSKLKLSSTRGEPVACSIAVFDQVSPSLTMSMLLQCRIYIQSFIKRIKEGTLILGYKGHDL